MVNKIIPMILQPRIKMEGRINMPRKTSVKLATTQNEQEDALQTAQGGDFTQTEMLYPSEAEPADLSGATLLLQSGEAISEPDAKETEEAEPLPVEISSDPEIPDPEFPNSEPPKEEPPKLPAEDTPQTKEKSTAKTTKPKTAKVKTVTKPAVSKQPKGQNARQSFYSLDFRALDRNLSPEQEQEWNSIYASFRSRSILTGTVIGVDDHTFDITGENGAIERKTVRSLIIIGYRVKVMIPETEVWAVGEEKPHYAIRGMVGAKVDYVIMRVDRENECAVASRRMALTKKRRYTLQTVRNNDDELVTCDTLMVSRKAVLVNYGGFDLVLTQKDLSYTAIADLRTKYRPGIELRARLMDFRENKPIISVREVNPNPFDGAELRHPVGSRRPAMIEGKYGGGVFCRLPDDTTCLCLYSNNLYDTEFETGDMVLVHITEFNYTRKLIYGRIIGKR